MLRFSLSSLHACGDARLLGEQIKARCTLLLRTLGAREHLHSRDALILRSLYTSTAESMDAMFLARYASSTSSSSARLAMVDTAMQSLCTRHGLCVETISELLLHSRDLYVSSSGADDAAYRQLQLQASLSALLEHLAALHSARHPHYLSVATAYNCCVDVKFNAISLAEHQENWSPHIIIGGASDAAALMISSRVKFSILEALKNALGSTIDRYRPLLAGIDVYDRVDEVPQVVVCVSEDERSIRIEVADRGAGLACADSAEDCFRFLRSASRRPSEMVDEQVSYQPMSSPLKGLGVGLSLSRLYMRQFGGDVTLSSEGLGKGATACILINKDSSVVEPSFDDL